MQQNFDLIIQEKLKKNCFNQFDNNDCNNEGDDRNLESRQNRKN